MPTVKLNESKHKQVPHPTKRGLLAVGEEVEATDLWMRQHRPLVAAGIIEVVEAKAKAPKKRAKKK